ncbi:MAG: polyprenyl synthetase family protein [Salinispira sp.]
MKSEHADDLFIEFHQPVKEAISDCLTILQNQNHPFGTFTSDTFKNLKEYTLRGKLIRGSLVPFTYFKLPGRQVPESDVYALSAVMEIFQSMLLIHDDIMDQDALRRGKPAIHRLYAREAEKEGMRNFNHYGECMGICIGDIAVFAAFAVVSRLNCEPGIIRDILELFSRELMLVGMAQMQDLRSSEIALRRLKWDDIIDTYRLKTGRYTFSLPMSLGAMLRDTDNTIRHNLETLGEYLGIIFQIKDDEIGMFGNPDETGKPNDSDIAEGKKTLFMHLLMSSMEESGKAELNRILENYRGADDLAWVRDNMERCSIREHITETLRKYAEKCADIIDALPQTPFSDQLRVFLAYNLDRGH